MGFRADAIQMFKDFRSDDDFADAFYEAHWTETQYQAGGGFGGSTVDVIHSATVLKMGNRDIINMFKATYDAENLFIKAIIDEFGEPEVDEALTFEGKVYSVASRQYDSVGALIALELTA